jgi:(S)-ureidoglycine aminohydrolase
VIPRGSMTDIVASYLPYWEHTRCWILARPLSGFAETFSHYVMEVRGGGGSDAPEPDPDAEAVLFVTSGQLRVSIDGTGHDLTAGGYVYLPPGTRWAARNRKVDLATFHWIRKAYEPVNGYGVPPAFVTNAHDLEPIPMPDTDGAWTTTRFVDIADLRHDMHVNIVNFEPGGTIPFPETHVMEHGLYVLEGKGVYLLNTD